MGSYSSCVLPDIKELSWRFAHFISHVLHVDEKFMRSNTSRQARIFSIGSVGSSNQLGVAIAKHLDMLISRANGVRVCSNCFVPLPKINEQVYTREDCTGY